MARRVSVRAQALRCDVFSASMMVLSAPSIMKILDA